MRFSNERHRSVNIIRRFNQRLREEKCNHDDYLHRVFYFLIVFSLTESCNTVFLLRCHNEHVVTPKTVSQRSIL
jgi:hypothetical protein